MNDWQCVNLLGQWTWHPDLVVRVVSKGVLVAEGDEGVGVGDPDEVSVSGVMSVVLGDPSM